MPESLVERYEQLLATDPTSTLFVELARVLVEQGENARAAEVCQQGLVHHPDSIHAYVLWGKALIGLGRPAEAMEQFDKAVAVDRSDPLAYHLISEVLVARGLYRSALPLLRKAVALSPGDEQVKVWLEQTQGALAGGPAPTIRPAVLDNPPERPLRPRANGIPTGSNPAIRLTRTGSFPPPPPPEALAEAAGRTPIPERMGSGSFAAVGDGPTTPGRERLPGERVGRPGRGRRSGHRAEPPRRRARRALAHRRHPRGEAAGGHRHHRGHRQGVREGAPGQGRREGQEEELAPGPRAEAGHRRGSPWWPWSPVGSSTGTPGR